MKKALGRASSLLGGMKYLLSTCNCLSQIFPFSQIINSLENRAMVHTHKNISSDYVFLY